METLPHTFIDIREYPEFASAHIEGSRLVPFSTLATASAHWDPTQPLTLVCKTGQRAEQARQLLTAQGFTSLAVLPGGIDAWHAAGKPLSALTHRPWSMERQVRITAGSLILLTLSLSHFISHYFLLVTAFIGAGLIFAGVSNTCMMASLLARLPWNRSSIQS